LGVTKGEIRLKGLFVLGAVTLSLGSAAPTISHASGPLADVPATVDFAFREGNRVTFASAAPGTVGSALRAAGFRLAPAARTDPGSGSPLRPGMQILIGRSPLGGAAPAHYARDLMLAGGDIGSTGLIVHQHGQAFYGRALASNVWDALTELNVAVGPDDRATISAPGQDPRVIAAADQVDVVEGMVVDIVHVTREQSQRREAIPFASRQVNDPNLDLGTTQVDQPGAPGVRTITTEVVYEDGVRKIERQLSDTVTLLPQDRVTRVGTRPQPLPADGSYRTVQKFESHNVTSYCLTGTTATGTQAGPGSIAVDPTVIKLGSHLYVDGYGFGYAVDTGGGIHGDDIDLWKTCDAAVAWGRQTRMIYVLDH
jgi:3D (Asp-Asp-Asp) domain-containing protein